MWHPVSLHVVLCLLLFFGMTCDTQVNVVYFLLSFCRKSRGHNLLWPLTQSHCWSEKKAESFHLLLVETREHWICICNLQSTVSPYLRNSVTICQWNYSLCSPACEREVYIYIYHIEREKNKSPRFSLLFSLYFFLVWKKILNF